MSVVAVDALDDRSRAAAVIDHLLRERFDGVFVDVLGGAFQANLARYLPAQLLRVLIVHNITPGTYAYARAVRDHVHATVGVSPRICADLVRSHGFSAEATSVISNGIEVERYVAGGERGAGPGLRVLLLGRIDDAAKGVLDLPRIARLLRDRDVVFTVAGDGPDMPALRRACRAHADRIKLLGAVAPEAVPRLLAEHDILLFPSRYEGLGLVLVEAMACGCVPVASRIQGVTDHVVDDGKTGLLFPVGSASGAAGAIRRLVDDRDLRRRLAAAAMASARQRFDSRDVAERYRALLQGLRVAPPPIAKPLQLDAWEYPAELKSGWRSSLPAPVKNILRVAVERSKYWLRTVP